MMLKATVTLGALMTAVISFAGHPALPQHKPFAYQPQPRTAAVGLTFGQDHAAGRAKVVDATPEELPGSGNLQLLDGPDGTTWFYTIQYEVEKVPIPGGYEGLMQTLIHGYTVTVYDNLLQSVGSITDHIELLENETRVADVSLAPMVTKKFFNSDDKYEIMVGIGFNRDLSTNPYPPVIYRSYAYSLGGTKDEAGDDQVICQMDGYVVDYINYAPDAWSENYYVTMLTEAGDPDLPNLEDYFNSLTLDTHIYRKASWGGGPQLMQTFSMPVLCLPGDQQNVPFMMSYLHDNKVHFAFSRYNKWYFSDPIADELEVTPDNTLDIDIYQVSGTELQLVQQTAIAVPEESDQEGLCTYMSIGSFRYEGDINYGDIDPAQPDKAAFFVTRQRLLNYNDDSLYAIDQYNAEGLLLKTIASDAETFVNLSDIAGFEPQTAFIKANADGTFTFTFTDLYSGEVIEEMPNDYNGLKLSVSLDRAVAGKSYNWVFSLMNAHLDADGNTIEEVAWIAPDGTTARLDELNIGKNVAYALVYIDGHALTPYLFNTNQRMEYMVLVKRSMGEGVPNQEELVIVDNEANTLMQLTPEADKGSLASVYLTNLASNPMLGVAYYNSTDEEFYQTYYNLPLEKFAGGDGSAENPYLIETIADITAIHSDPAAHYKVVADINASGYEFGVIESIFTGSVEGDGHTISDLTINGANIKGRTTAMFYYLGQGASISDLTFVNPAVKVTDNANYAALIAGQASGATLSNLKVIGLRLDAPAGTATVGGLVARTSLAAVIEGCYVANAVVSAPTTTVGGIVGQAFTGSVVNATAFVGSIEGDSEVGGMVGSINKADVNITNCHVNAAITAANTVGGIAGSSSRGIIRDCVVEGSIEATAHPRWYNHGPCAGGIVGELAPDYEGTVTEPAAETACVYGCYVDLSSLKGFETTDAEQWVGQYNTLHRIVGHTAANVDVRELGRVIDEFGLYDNYASEAMAAVDATGTTTVEGESIDPYDLSQEFFEGIGYEFGLSNAAPWRIPFVQRPTLYFETGAVSQPEILTVKVADLFYTHTLFISATPLTEEEVLDGLVADITNPIASMTGNYQFADNTLSIEWEAINEGTAQITVGSMGVTANTDLVVAPLSGVGEVVAGAKSAISYDGVALRAEGCVLTLYSVGGSAVASARDSLNVSTLAAGVYVAVAIDADGQRSVLKVVKK